FSASGDFGDVGDPLNNLKMDQQTLVGGTILQTIPVTAAPPKAVYPNDYYAGEATWNQARFLRDKAVTGGGIMDGNDALGLCKTFPFLGPCSATPIPDYQLGVSMAMNGGSTQFRNYPDVALLASNIEFVFNGATIVTGGTSAAAPLWAGFMALVKQRMKQN